MNVQAARLLRRLGWRLKTIRGEPTWEHPRMWGTYWSMDAAIVQALEDSVRRIDELEGKARTSVPEKWGDEPPH